MNIKKSSRSAGKVAHGLLGDVGRMVIQDDTDGGIGRIVSIHLFKQRYKLTTAMPVMNLSNHVAVIQIQSRLIISLYYGLVTDSTALLAEWRARKE